MRKPKKFSQYLKEDLNRTFFNERELMDWYLVGDKRIQGVLTSDQFGDAAFSKEYKNLNVNNTNQVFYCRQEDLPKNYQKLRTLKIDHTEYKVIRVSDELGVAAFTLQSIMQQGGYR